MRDQKQKDGSHEQIQGIPKVEERIMNFEFKIYNISEIGNKFRITK